MESPGCLCPLSEDVLAVETEEEPYVREVRFGTRLCGTHPRPAGKADLLKSGHSGQFPRAEGGGTLEDTPVIIVGVSMWQAWVPVLGEDELGPLLARRCPIANTTGGVKMLNTQFGASWDRFGQLGQCLAVYPGISHYFMVLECLAKSRDLTVF